jgi:hypothetical protein
LRKPTAGAPQEQVRAKEHTNSFSYFLLPIEDFGMTVADRCPRCYLTE